MIDKERLAQKCSTWNIVLSGAQLDLLDRYAEILVDYNQKVNLTAITSPEGIEDRHFADSLLFAAQPEVTGKLVDVGTGAGFPGVVAKNFQAGFATDPDGAHRQAGGLFEVPVRGTWPDRGRVCQGARRGSRPQNLA